MKQLEVDYTILKEKYQTNVYAMNQIDHYYGKHLKTINSRHIAQDVKIEVCQGRMNQLELILKKYQVI